MHILYLQISKYIITTFSVYIILCVCFQGWSFGYIYNTRCSIVRGGKKTTRSTRGWLSFLWLCLLETSEAIAIKSHQRDWLNMNWTRTVTDIANVGRESTGNLIPMRRTTGNQGVLEVWKTSSAGKCTPSGYPYQMASQEKFQFFSKYLEVKQFTSGWSLSQNKT